MTLPHHWKPQSITATTAPPLFAAVNEFGNYVGIAPVSVIVPYGAGVLPANDYYQWKILGSCKVLSIVATFSGNLTGNFTIEIYDEGTLKRTITLAYNQAGTTLTDAWIYEPISLYLKEGCTIKTKSSTALTGLEAYCSPIIIDGTVIGVNV